MSSSVASQEILFDLITRGKWKKIRSIFKKDPIAASSFIDCTGYSTLSCALSAYNAPISIIETIIQANPHATLQLDNYGATSLHIACLNGVSLKAVRYIIDHDKGESTRVYDSQNSTVLHHAIEYICLVLINEIHEDDLPRNEYGSLTASSGGCSTTRVSRSHRSEAIMEYEEYLKIIELLCKTNPEMVHIETTLGATPLDIPQLILVNSFSHDYKDDTGGHRNSLNEVYQILRRVSINLYRQKKRIWERQGLFDIHENESMVSKSLPSLEGLALESSSLRSQGLSAMDVSVIDA